MFHFDTQLSKYYKKQVHLMLALTNRWQSTTPILANNQQVECPFQPIITNVMPILTNTQQASVLLILTTSQHVQRPILTNSYQNITKSNKFVSQIARKKNQAKTFTFYLIIIAYLTLFDKCNLSETEVVFVLDSNK